jgi:hypothetical protein
MRASLNFFTKMDAVELEDQHSTSERKGFGFASDLV